ncbi:MAG: arginase family protein [Bryobacteraceae bacterium]
MHVHLLAVPYDSGRKQERMGRGPLALLDAGLPEIIAAQRLEATCEILECRDEHMAEIRSTFTLASQISERVSGVHALGGVSVVLSGNCNGALGTIAGLGSSSTAVLWFDAHGEYETPETTHSGFLDGMGLAIGTGACWRNLSQQIVGFNPIPRKHITLVGVRQLGTEEERNLGRSGIHVIPAESVRQQTHLDTVKAAAEAARHCTSLYIHFDLDALDSELASWNSWTSPGGLSVEQISSVVREFASRLPVGAVGFASYEPAADRDEDGAKAAGKLLLACMEMLKTRGTSGEGRSRTGASFARAILSE